MPVIKKKRLLMDMDGIVVDFFDPLFREYRKKTGEQVTISQILGWDMSSYVGQGDVLMSLFHRKGYFLGLKPNPGAVEALKEISKYCEVIIASYACTHHAAGEKFQWCARYLPFISPNNIFLCHKKELIRADGIVDDGLHNAAAYKIAWPKALVLGIEYPYNDDHGKVYDYRVPDYAHMAKAWRQITRLVKKHV